jgi:hypothetical protein
MSDVPVIGQPAAAFGVGIAANKATAIGPSRRSATDPPVLLDADRIGATVAPKPTDEADDRHDQGNAKNLVHVQISQPGPCCDPEPSRYVSEV